ncbi:hypothetical protein EDM76_09290 [bacterium]|nr:MAG: hypothetical protein EDM76_09290 [bacterium]
MMLDDMPDTFPKPRRRFLTPRRLLVTGILGTIWAFSTVELRARQMRLGYDFASVRSRHIQLSREVEALRYACARRAAPTEILAQGKDLGLDLRPEPPRETRPAPRPQAARRRPGRP